MTLRLPVAALAAHLGHTMKQCMACHATFRVR
jgi:cytochrome c556